MNFKRVAALLLAGAMVMTAVPVYAKGDDVTLSVSIWDTNQEPGIRTYSGCTPTRVRDTCPTICFLI